MDRQRRLEQNEQKWFTQSNASNLMSKKKKRKNAKTSESIKWHEDSEGQFTLPYPLPVISKT